MREEELEDWKEWEREQEMKSQLPAPVEWTIKKGDKFDITHLLSSPKRDYLIKNNGDKVKIKELCGKHVLLYFWWLTYDGLYKRYSTGLDLNVDLEEIYRAYNPVGAFEVVFVALGKNKDVFNVSFSRVPWLAIPHKDQKARDLLRTKFSIPFPTSARAVLFAPDGTVLLKDCEDVFRTFGAEGFPFTKQKMRDIWCEADALWDELAVKKQKLSLNTLLGDYLISSEGDQVSTSLLEGKIVGLYFFDVSYEGFERTRKLLKIWKKAKDRLYENFEIVFINDASACLSFAKDQFKKKFRCTIPWYSLPVDGRKLCQVFKIYGSQRDHSWNNAGYFVVLQPDKYQPLSYFAFDILEEFGIDAYPFILEKAVMIEKIKQQEKLVLGKLLSSSAPLRRGVSSSFKEDTTVSKLLGKHVLLFFATHSCYTSGLFLSALKRMYYEKKGTEDDFEIIYISLDCNESPSSFPLSIQEMPWLIHSYVPNFAAALAEMVFVLPFHLPAIAAFGPDGHIVAKESNLAFKKEWNSMYPFIEADMCKEVHRELQIINICFYKPILPPISRIACAVSLALTRSHLVAPGIFALIVREITWTERTWAEAERFPSKDIMHMHAQDGNVYLTSFIFSLLEGLILFLRAIYLVIIFSPCIAMAPFADSFGIEFRKTWLRVVRLTLENAGPAFIKWGQWAATRPDLFPGDLCTELAELQTNAPVHGFDYTKRTIEKAFGRKLPEIFEQFEEKPVASGSIAQVHRATLKFRYPGQRISPILVAVKVRHPGVSEAIKRDFMLINFFAKLSNFNPTLKWFRLDESLQQFAVFMMSQVDLAREAANLSRFTYNFRRWKDVSFPKPLYPLVHPAVLVETYEHGESILHYVDELDGHEPIKRGLAHLGTHALLKMLLVDNFIHADMHPGNILVRVSQSKASSKGWFKSKPHVIFLDVGMTAELSKKDRVNLLEFFKAVALRDGRTAAECTLKLSKQQNCPNPAAFIKEVERSFVLWGSTEGDFMHPADCMHELLEQVRHHRVNIDGNVTTVMVTTLVLEGWQRKLDPEYDVMHTLQTLLFKVDWAESLIYTIEGLMAP